MCVFSLTFVLACSSFSLGSMSQLTGLYLYANKLSGSIPPRYVLGACALAFERAQASWVQSHILWFTEERRSNRWNGVRTMPTHHASMQHARVGLVVVVQADFTQSFFCI